MLGQAAFPSLAELPGPADLVVIAVPASGLDAAVDDALAAGARAIVAITAGSHESPDAAAAQASLAARVRAAGAVLLGPNCLGVMDAGEQLELATADLPAGAIGLISQSGNLALELGLLAARDGLGFSRFASLGNQADLGATELLCTRSAAHEPTRLIALYLEDFRDGRAFARAARTAVDAGKPVVALAIAGGAVTARAVASHTGALASDDAAIDALLEAAGVHRVRTPQELIDTSSVLLRCRADGRPAGHGAGRRRRPRVDRRGRVRAPRPDAARAERRTARARCEPACRTRPRSRTRSISPAAPSRTCTRSTGSRTRCSTPARPTRCS